MRFPERASSFSRRSDEARTVSRTSPKRQLASTALVRLRARATPSIHFANASQVLKSLRRGTTTLLQPSGQVLARLVSWDLVRWALDA